MKKAPRLLNFTDNITIPHHVPEDLQLNKILSEATTKILCCICEKDELLCRRELFMHLQSDNILNKITVCINRLNSYEKTLMLFKAAKTPLEKDFMNLKALSGYIDVCEILSSLTDCGKLCLNIAAFFEGIKDNILPQLKSDIKNAEDILSRSSNFIVSMSDDFFLTPDTAPESEFDAVTACVKELGFDIPQKSRHNIPPHDTLSDAFYRLYADSVKELLSIFDKYAHIDLHLPTSYIGEFKFFMEIRTLTEKAKASNIPFCFPEVSETTEYTAENLYDVSLFSKGCDSIVPNDTYFTDTEPFFFLTGANGGGKTTYLRAVGTNLLLFLAGCPVFAKKAKIYPFSYFDSHFPADERFNNTGRLDEEVLRVNETLKHAAGTTAFLLFNETFSGTDDKRGFELLINTSEKIRSSKHFGLFVTHFHEVESTDFPLLGAEIDTIQENKRTYRIVNRKSRSSYAADILKKYRLDKKSLCERRGEKWQ